MEHNLTTKHATKWSKLLLVLALVYVSSGAIAVLPQNIIFDLIAVLWLLAFIVTWLPFPYILYKDRKQSVKETDWSPSKAYYLGWLPGYIGIIAVFMYLARRNEAYEQVETGEVETQETEDDLDTDVSFKDETENPNSQTKQTTETEYATTENTSYSVFDDDEK